MKRVQPDPYLILGVPRDADLDTIRAAFRRLARRHHPDVAGNAGEQMVVINWAYALLTHPERRRAYDQEHLPPARERPAPPPQPPVEPPLWADALEGHAEDWQQMFEEERQRWEQLLAAQPPGHPQHAATAAELERAKQAQLELENALRARDGLAALDQAQFESQRLQAQALARPTAAGCVSTLIGLLLALLPLAVLSVVRRAQRKKGKPDTQPSAR